MADLDLVTLFAQKDPADKAHKTARIAARVAEELHDGDVVNLGIGLPTQVPKYIGEDIIVTLHSENGFTGLDTMVSDPSQADVDIIDSGNTLYKLTPILKGRNPKTLKVVSLLDKPERREVPFKADYRGFEIPDEFVVGFGLDYDQKYRNLPYIGVLHL